MKINCLFLVEDKTSTLFHSFHVLRHITCTSSGNCAPARLLFISLEICNFFRSSLANWISIRSAKLIRIYCTSSHENHFHSTIPDNTLHYYVSLERNSHFQFIDLSSLSQNCISCQRTFFIFDFIVASLVCLSLGFLRFGCPGLTPNHFAWNNVISVATPAKYKTLNYCHSPHPNIPYEMQRKSIQRERGERGEKTKEPQQWKSKFSAFRT